jgi:hypothetical protein
VGEGVDRLARGAGEGRIPAGELRNDEQAALRAGQGADGRLLEGDEIEASAGRSSADGSPILVATRLLMDARVLCNGSWRRL